jgi:hypothetical protein
MRSAAKSKPLDQLLVLGWLSSLQVIKVLATLVNQPHEPAARRMIALVRAEVFTQAVDALGEQSNLYLRGPGIFRVTLILSEYFALSFRRQTHCASNL